MVEEDPDKETYYEMGGSGSNIPVRIYRVMHSKPSYNIMQLSQNRNHINGSNIFYILLISKS